MNKLCKIEKEGKISGVCAGLARYFNIDVTIIRIIWLVALFMGIGSPVLIYIVMALVMPECGPSEVSFVSFDDEKEEDDPYNTDERY